MGRINVLQPNVFNILAAGEVVESPASVVKELVENSLDAGASEIDVYVEGGGIRKVQVSDNGIGILREDMRAAFMPHATSKISTADDLDSLATLGFRGEALASIASVSEITLISAPKSQAVSTKIALRGGTVIEESEDSRSKGTIITVENLFFNTPARLKFLKKPANEMRAVLDVMRTLILSNPGVSFTLSNEDGDLLRHEAGELVDAVCAVYGAKTVDKLLEIKDCDNAKIKVSGFISSVDFTKPNRTYQTVIINGRAVSDITVQTAVERGYGDALMKRAYPMFILDIIMPFDEVDVNVHPRKSEVRFYDKQSVFGAVYHCVQNTVNASLNKSALGFSVNETNKDISNNASVSEPAYVERVEQTAIDTSSLYKKTVAPPAPSFYAPKISHAFKEAPSYMNFDIPLSKPKEDYKEEQAEEESEFVFDGKIIGQIFATYLLVERDEKLYIIDQHAAHERILYDSIVKRCKPDYTQSLLIPYKLSLTADEGEYLESIMPALRSLGFEIERTEYVYLVKAVPEPVSEMNLARFFGELISQRCYADEITLAGLLREKLCQQACKGAIKGGEVLTRAQIEQVIRNYSDDNGNLPIKCPHGRPAVIALDRRDFEKMFKRIV